VKLNRCQQKAPGHGGSSGGMSNFKQECFIRYRFAARACHTSPFLYISKHSFAPNPIVRMAHHSQHLEGR
jgi:hypothetical protein